MLSSVCLDLCVCFFGWTFGYMRSFRRVCAFVCFCPFCLLFQDGTANIVHFVCARGGGGMGMEGVWGGVVCAYESVRHCVCVRLCVRACVRACVRVLVRVPLCAFGLAFV